MLPKEEAAAMRSEVDRCSCIFEKQVEMELMMNEVILCRISVYSSQFA